MPNNVNAIAVEQHIIGPTYAARSEESDQTLRRYVASGALHTKRITGGNTPMAVIQDPDYNNGRPDFFKADQARYWYRAMDKYEFEHLVKYGKLNLSPESLRPREERITAEEANRLMKETKNKKGKKAPNLLKKALNVTADEPPDFGYLGIGPNASYSRKYMGEKKTQNWLVEFMDPDGVVYKTLAAMTLGNKIALPKGEGGGTWGLGQTGTLAGALCGKEFNKLLIGEATRSDGVAQPMPGVVVWRLIEAMVPISELGMPVTE